MLLRQKIALLGMTISMTAFALPAVAAEQSEAAAKAELCFGCHGEDGISLSPSIPNLRGQKSEYLLNTISDFKRGHRQNSMMQAIIAGVPDEDVKVIVDYYSNLK
ncbi:MAG: cytochrome c [Gammaproteobacteria bacterium]|nr:cytochrome c [Gammaproteobacteria bacterium]